MRLAPQQRTGLTVVELMVASSLVGAFALVLYSLLNLGTILGAKNVAVNTAHQQARIAMLQILQDLHSAVSVPALTDVNGTILSDGDPAPGVTFQLVSQGPLQISTDANAGQKVLKVKTSKTITAGQRLIVRTHGIEDNIAAASAPSNGVVTLTMTNNLPAKIDVTSGNPDYNIVCYITDRFTYVVVPANPQPASGFSGSLQLKGASTNKTLAVLVNDIKESKPFSIPTDTGDDIYHRSVVAVNLSTADSNSSNRKFKSSSMLLNGNIPIRAKLADKQ